MVLKTGIGVGLPGGFGYRWELPEDVPLQRH